MEVREASRCSSWSVSGIHQQTAAGFQGVCLGVVVVVMVMVQDEIDAGSFNSETSFQSADAHQVGNNAA